MDNQLQCDYQKQFNGAHGWRIYRLAFMVSQHWLAASIAVLDLSESEWTPSWGVSLQGLQATLNSTDDQEKELAASLCELMSSLSDGDAIEGELAIEKLISSPRVMDALGEPGGSFQFLAPVTEEEDLDHISVNMPRLRLELNSCLRQNGDGAVVELRATAENRRLVLRYPYGFAPSPTTASR
jgi:hypothetical protein